MGKLTLRHPEVRRHVVTNYHKSIVLRCISIHLRRNSSQVSRHVIGGVTLNLKPTHRTPADEVAQDGRVLRRVVAAELGHKGSLYVIIRPVRDPTIFIQPVRIVLIPVWAKTIR